MCLLLFSFQSTHIAVLRDEKCHCGIYGIYRRAIARDERASDHMVLGVFECRLVARSRLLFLCVWVEFNEPIGPQECEQIFD